MNDISEQNYKQGGYAKAGVKPSSFRWIKSRATGPDGKVYQGEMGLRLQEKKLERQEYLKRNG